MPLLSSSALQLLRQLLNIVVISFAIFLLVRAVPGDVIDFYAARGDYDTQSLAAMRADLGLDDGLSTQFGLWTRAALRGDLGLSMRFGTPVADMLVHALPASLKLAGASLLAGLALGMGLAVLALAAPRSPAAAAIESLNVWSIAVPTFCTGVLGILAFSIWLGWLPIRGQMLLPVLILGLDIAGQIAKPLHEELRETARAGFIRTAHAKGLSPWRIAWRHILPNSLSVVIALAGVILGGLIGGTLTMEALFGLPGLGSLTLDAIRGRDYPVIQAAVMLLATSVVVVNVATTLLHRWADPRTARRQA
ncbi:MAG: peptide ABC transporter permease [Bordetella sp. SCN 67-23]|nr:ABC transporter permease [Burkholderiales bacterium]ODS76530.1 MAG: peptide ABC transporter permease [Bordetella sp. SCN 67-23]OJW86732.1 MAG: peptide ABC transporter permease [Burkholderiales bacterium 67-32]